MARLRLYHETDTPGLRTLEPKVPAVDVGSSAGKLTWKTTGEGDDKRPAVWLSEAPDDYTPYTTPRRLYRYVAEVDDSDGNLVQYNKAVRGWYRYLAPLQIAEFLTLDRERDSYVTLATLEKRYLERAEELSSAHAAYKESMAVALDEPDVSKKSAMRAAVLEQKQRLLDAAAETDAAYQRFFAARLAAPPVR